MRHYVVRVGAQIMGYYLDRQRAQQLAAELGGDVVEVSGPLPGARS